MEIKPHNPHMILVQQSYFPRVYSNWKTAARRIDLVYGIENNGGNEGLEVYFFKNDGDTHHYYSRRFVSALCNIPAQYLDKFNRLKEIAPGIPVGHKAHVN